MHKFNALVTQPSCFELINKIGNNKNLLSLNFLSQLNNSSFKFHAP